MVMSPQTSKYRPFPARPNPERSWPDQPLTCAPTWMSTDLRDGNQALFEPMDAARKLELFRLLVAIGFREIEVAFPAASSIEFDFVRVLIEGGEIPAGVRIIALTPARPELIRRTVAALAGAPEAIVHLYTATSPVFRQNVFGMSEQELTALTVDATRLIRELTAQHPETRWGFEYSAETFSATEPEFALSICNSVVDAWDPQGAERVIINLPATVEMATPNVYADQIEWMHRHLSRRSQVTLSVHPHNDRGTAVAAAELALMAGAERVEGCLFGNGERTGNVDLVTLALNLYSQGVDPGLDFARIAEITRTWERCTGLPVHPRHPYAGDLVFTAFSGSHQDAIRKGMAAQAGQAQWSVPYLPVDPADLGRTYDSLIRVNSQSGKGGIAFLLEREYGIVLPRRLQVEFSARIQQLADTTGGEITAAEIWRCFSGIYLEPAVPLELVSHELTAQGERQGITLQLRVAGRRVTLRGIGNGPIDAALDALGSPVRVLGYEERSTSGGADARAAAFVELAADGVPGSLFGVGLDANIVTASLRAVISGLNRLASVRPDIVIAHSLPQVVA
ncbi:MAG: 2-isopropylmalate synthase [Chromatiales bacterium]|nr:2-isopropylmalate synthase [Chromatiales bacterium]